jgi:hypothetical protein
MIQVVKRLWGTVVGDDCLPNLGVLDDRRLWMDDGNPGMDDVGSEAYVVIRGVWLAWKMYSTFVDWAVYLKSVIPVGLQQEKSGKEVDCWATSVDLLFDVVQTRYRVTSDYQRLITNKMCRTHQDIGIMRGQGVCIFTPIGPLGSIPGSGRRWPRAHRLSFRKRYRRDITTGSNGH